jgi:hypothetical protein
MAMGGIGGKKPVMGGEWIGGVLQKLGLLGEPANDAPSAVADFAGGMLSPSGAAKAMLAASMAPIKAFHVSSGGPIKALESRPMWFSREGEKPFIRQGSTYPNAHVHEADLDIKKPLDVNNATPETWNALMGAYKTKGGAAPEKFQEAIKHGEFGIGFDDSMLSAMKSLGYDSVTMNKDIWPGWLAVLDPSLTAKLTK